MKPQILKSEKLCIILYIILTLIISRSVMFLVYMGMKGDGSVLNCIAAYNIWDAEWYEGYAKGFLNGNFP